MVGPFFKKSHRIIVSAHNSISLPSLLLILFLFDYAIKLTVYSSFKEASRWI